MWRSRGGRPRTDFGRGFYTTTLLRQAQTWAFQTVQTDPGGAAAVVAVEVDRNELAALEVLSFVRGDFDAEDFWSLVVHCRSGNPDHARANGGWYDVVAGPVASFWRQRLTISGVDQMSFHTAAAERVINTGRRWIEWTRHP